MGSSYRAKEVCPFCSSTCSIMASFRRSFSKVGQDVQLRGVKEEEDDEESEIDEEEVRVCVCTSES